jgi:hypothetical protein
MRRASPGKLRLPDIMKKEATYFSWEAASFYCAIRGLQPVFSLFALYKQRFQGEPREGREKMHRDDHSGE